MIKLYILSIFLLSYSCIQSQNSNDYLGHYKKSLKYARKCFHAVNIEKPIYHISSDVEKIFIELIDSDSLTKFNFYADSVEYFYKEAIKFNKEIIDGQNLQENLANFQLFRQHINSVNNFKININESKNEIKYSDFIHFKTNTIISQCPKNGCLITNDPKEYLQLEYSILKNKNLKNLKIIYKPKLENPNYRKLFYNSKLSNEISKKAISKLHNFGFLGKQIVSLDSIIEIVNKDAYSLAFSEIGGIEFKYNSERHLFQLSKHQIKLEDISLLEYILLSKTPILFTYNEPLLATFKYIKNTFTYKISDSTFIEKFNIKETSNLNIRNFPLSKYERNEALKLTSIYIWQSHTLKSETMYNNFKENILSNPYLKISDSDPSSLLQLFCTFNDHEKIIEFFKNDPNVDKISGVFNISKSVQDKIKPFVESKIKLSNTKFIVNENNLEGLWSPVPRYNIPPHCDSITPYTLLSISYSKGKMGLISSMGEILLSPQFDSIKIASTGNYFLYKENKVALYNFSYSKVSNFDYDSMSSVDHSNYIVKINGKYGVATYNRIKGLHLTIDCNCDSIKINKDTENKKIDFECIKL